jgi:hypothetical protein
MAPYRVRNLGIDQVWRGEFHVGAQARRQLRWQVRQ